jgi:hypothetical protein
VDVVPDVIPVLGQLDDVGIIMLGLRTFFEVAPPEVVREYLKRFVRPVADSEWKVMADKPESEPPGEVVEGDFRLANPAEGDKPPTPPDE